MFFFGNFRLFSNFLLQFFYLLSKVKNGNFIDFLIFIEKEKFRLILLDKDEKLVRGVK